MATERVTTRDDGLTTERIVERDIEDTAYLGGDGPGIGGVVIGIVLLALVAIVAFFLLSARHNRDVGADGLDNPAAGLAGPAPGGAKSVDALANAAGESAARSVR